MKKKKDFFLLIFTQNIDRVYTFIEPPQPRHSLPKSVVSPRLPEFSQYWSNGEMWLVQCHVNERRPSGQVSNQGPLGL